MAGGSRGRSRRCPRRLPGGGRGKERGCRIGRAGDQGRRTPRLKHGKVRIRRPPQPARNAASTAGTARAGSEATGHGQAATNSDCLDAAPAGSIPAPDDPGLIVESDASGDKSLSRGSESIGSGSYVKVALVEGTGEVTTQSEMRPKGEEAAGGGGGSGDGGGAPAEVAAGKPDGEGTKKEEKTPGHGKKKRRRGRGEKGRESSVLARSLPRDEFDSSIFSQQQRTRCSEP